ncbi:MAG: hypothetical protein AAF789_10695 [Bacteroidota bacterium]
MSQKVFEVKEVNISILESLPPQLLIEASGIASSSGWSNPTLVPTGSQKDGIYEFDFMADLPTDGFLTVLTPIEGSHVIQDIPADLKGVKVIAEQNSITQQTASKEPRNVGVIGPTMPKIEPLLGASVFEDRLVIRAQSGGCTKKEHFRIDINRGVTGIPPFFVTVTRLVDDHCRAFLPNGIELTYTFKELGLDNGTDLIFTNPIGSKTATLPLNLQEAMPTINWPLNPPPSNPWPWPFPVPSPWPQHPWNPIDPRNPWGPFGPRPVNPFGSDLNR